MTAKADSREYFIFGAGDDGGERAWQIEPLGPGRFRLTGPEGTSCEVDAYEPEAGRVHLLLEDGRALEVDLRLEDQKARLEVAGERWELDVLNARQRRMRAAGVGGTRELGPELVSPMAGKVVAVEVTPGQEVDEGQTVVIIEAMKMENDLKAHHGGTIGEVLVEPGQTVEIGDVLVRIERADG